MAFKPFNLQMKARITGQAHILYIEYDPSQIYHKVEDYQTGINLQRNRGIKNQAAQMHIKIGAFAESVTDKKMISA
jgi:hypothetical protein